MSRASSWIDCLYKNVCYSFLKIIFDEEKNICFPLCVVSFGAGFRTESIGISRLYSIFFLSFFFQNFHALGLRLYSINCVLLLGALTTSALIPINIFFFFRENGIMQRE